MKIIQLKPKKGDFCVFCSNGAKVLLSIPEEGSTLFVS
jgi:hypothetical protein